MLPPDDDDTPATAQSEKNADKSFTSIPVIETPQRESKRSLTATTEGDCSPSTAQVTDVTQDPTKYLREKADQRNRRGNNVLTIPTANPTYTKESRDSISTEPLEITSTKRRSSIANASNRDVDKLTDHPAGGSYVTASDVADELEDLDEEEEEEDGDSLIFKTLIVTLRLLFGSRSGLGMFLVLAVSLVVLSIVTTAQEEKPPWLTYVIFASIALGIMEVLQITPIIWKHVVIRLLFPESRILSFISELIDPDFWNLLFTSSCLIIWQVCQEVSPYADNMVHFQFIPSGWDPVLTEVSSDDVHIIKYVLIFNLLWAIRDCFVSFVMFRLMLGFLMNFNSEIVTFFQKYSLIRRLNAGWIKLLPTRSIDNDLTYPENAGSSFSLLDPVVAEVARAKAIIIRENLEMNPVQMSKLREESKQRLLRTAVTRDLSKLNAPQFSGSRPTISSSGMRPPEVPDNIRKALTSLVSGPKQVEAVAAEDHLDTSTVNASIQGYKRRIDLTPAMKKRRVREFHVEFTGRAMPRVLERNHIHKLSKSRILNMMAVNWLEANPVVVFPDGARTELTSKKLAREAGDALFRTLLTFRQSIGLFDETLNQVLEIERSSIRADGLAGQQPTTALPKQQETSFTPAAEVTLAPAKDVETAYDVADFYTPPIVNIEAVHQAQKPESETEHVGRFHHRDLHGPKSSVHWFKRRKNSCVDPSMSTIPQNASSPTQQQSSGFSTSYSRPALSVTAKPAGMGASKPMTEAQLAAITAAEIRKVKMIMPDDKECLTQDFFELFMSTPDAKDLMEFLDPGKLGRVTSKMFIRGVVSVYRLRKQMVTSLQAQAEIEGVFRTVCRFFIGGFCFAAYLIILGVNPNTILVSGAALASAAGVILSFVYTDFIQSIILIVFLNPYRIGDRVRIDGEAQYVKRITTYFTEFESLHGRIQYLSHKDLSAKLLINESRCKNATTEIELSFGEKTTPAQYNALKKVLTAYLKSRPLEYIGDSLFMFIAGIGPTQYIRISFWITHTEGWGNWMAVRTQESNFFHFLMRQAALLGMNYKLPIQRWEVVQYPTSANASSPSGTSTGRDSKLPAHWPSAHDLGAVSRLPPPSFQSTYLHAAPMEVEAEEFEGNIFDLPRMSEESDTLYTLRRRTQWDVS